MIPVLSIAMQIELWLHTCRCPNCSRTLLGTLAVESGYGCLN